MSTEPIVWTVYWETEHVGGWDFYWAHNAEHAKEQHRYFRPKDKITRVHKGYVEIKAK